MTHHSHIMFRGNTYTLAELEQTGHSIILQKGISAYELDASAKGLGYFTFLDDGFSHGIATLLVSENYPEYILVSAKEADMGEAVKTIIFLNGHLVFRPGGQDVPVTGNADPTRMEGYKLFFNQD